MPYKPVLVLIYCKTATQMRIALEYWTSTERSYAKNEKRSYQLLFISVEKFEQDIYRAGVVQLQNYNSRMEYKTRDVFCLHAESSIFELVKPKR